MNKIDLLIKKFKEVKEDLIKMNGSSPTPPTLGGTATINSQIGSPFGKKEDEGKGHSSFTMDHVNAVVKMPHREGQQYAHKIVEESTANPANKAKMKRMIIGSKSSAHLAQGMSNHILAHPSEGLRVAKSEKLSTDKNGQWSLSKLEESDLPKERHEVDQDDTAKILRPHPMSGNIGVTPIPAAGRTSLDEASADAKTKTMKVYQADSEEKKKKCSKCKDGSCTCSK